MQISSILIPCRRRKESMQSKSIKSKSGTPQLQFSTKDCGSLLLYTLLAVQHPCNSVYQSLVYSDIKYFVPIISAVILATIHVCQGYFTPYPMSIPFAMKHIFIYDKTLYFFPIRLAIQKLPQLGIFEGKQSKLYFTHEINLLEKGLYRLAGQMTAWSILHGGMGFPMIHPLLYSMMCGMSATDQFSIQDITDADVLCHLQKVRAD